MPNLPHQKPAKVIIDSRFANPKLAEIAESFQVRPAHRLAYYLVIELFAFLSLLLGTIVIFPFIVFIFSLPATFLGILANLFGIKLNHYFLIVSMVSALCSYYISYSLITKYFFKTRTEAKRARVNALTALSTRPEDPVLYLRSFADDEAINPRSRSQKTYEEDLALALNAIGPVMAIGEPLEADTHLGATRVYLKHTDWQKNVRRLMQISQLIIIQPGKSAGVIWELEAALESVDPRKVIMSFLSWQHLGHDARELEHDLFRRRVNDFMSQSPSPVTIKLPEKIGSATFLVFSNDWEPELISTPRWIKWLYRFSSSLFVTEALRRALRNRDLKLSWWRNVPYLFLISWLILGFAFTVYRFPNTLYWEESGVIFWFHIGSLLACVIVLAWSVSNFFLFFCRKVSAIFR